MKMRFNRSSWSFCRVKLACLMVAICAAAVCAQQENCNYADGIVAQAREKARPNADPVQIERYSRLLEGATSQCQGNGDAWYYRYLYARQLGKKSEADYCRQRAEQFESAALRRNEDPFTPAPSSVARPTAPAGTSEPNKAATRKTSNLSAQVREKWALVIGISKFRDENIPALDYSAKDARDVADLLKDSNYGRFKSENVILLQDEKATTVEIKRQIEELIKKAQQEDLVVFYLSSHGSPRRSSPTGVNFVVTHDTEVSSLYATSLSMIDIVDDLDTLIKAQRVVMFLDTCYSGEAGGGFSPRRSKKNGSNASTWGSSAQGAKKLEPEGQGISEEVLSRIGDSPGRVIIAASRPNEVSWESDKLKNSIFTYYLIQAIKQKNGLSPIKDVFDYLSVEVAKRALSEKNQPQHPILVTSDGQDQVDIRLGAAASRPR